MREKDGSGRLKIPDYDVLNDLMNKIDPDAYAETLTRWLRQNKGSLSLPQSLALDGEAIGNGKCGMIVTLCRQEDGRPVGRRAATGKKKKKKKKKKTAQSVKRAAFWRAKTPSSPTKS